jgi:hydroxymethylpyrimidine pyrophosphatase-like HAD family hydrolase
MFYDARFSRVFVGHDACPTMVLMHEGAHNGGPGQDSKEQDILLATDLDGTLLGADRLISATNRAALRVLGELGVVRVVATGRSLWSAERVLPDDLPLDYLVFSSGAGTVAWPSRALVAARHMPAADLACVIAVLDGLGCDYMVQGQAPRSHEFAHRKNSLVPNPDFDRRIDAYAEHSRPLANNEVPSGSQFVVVQPPEAGIGLWSVLCERLPALNVVRTTSPIDGRSLWVEIFPAGVSKADGCQAIATRHKVAVNMTLAVGNDYNDTDLLDWAALSFVVENGPADLKARHRTAPTNLDDGVAVAISGWCDLHGLTLPGNP